MATYGDISPRTAAFAIKQLLSRAHQDMVLEKFGSAQTLPSNSTKTAKFRRYNALAISTTPLSEGVAPSGTPMTVTDVSVTLEQHGAYVPTTDVIADTHEDPVLSELTSGLIPQQAAETIETIRYGVLKAGTNKFFAGGVVDRASVAAVFDLKLQRKIVRSLKRQNARKITKVIKASVNIATEPVAASYVCVIHPDLEPTIRGLAGFVPIEKYAGITPFESELGKVEDVRYITSTLNSAYANAGAAPGADLVSTGGAKADVYSMLFLGADAYGIIALKGKFAAEIFVANPRPTPGVDPLAQQGSVGWKTMQGAVILNDLWMAVAEVGAPAL